VVDIIFIQLSGFPYKLYIADHVLRYCLKPDEKEYHQP
jgi:preprotein translocase subunit Sss1